MNRWLLTFTVLLAAVAIYAVFRQTQAGQTLEQRIKSALNRQKSPKGEGTVIQLNPNWKG